MINLELAEDNSLIDSMFDSLKVEKPENAVFAVVKCDKTPVGIAAFYYSDTVHIKGVGILEEFRSKGYGDFTTRVLLSRLADYGKEIIVDYVSDYFYKFGFNKKGGVMSVFPDKLIFPSKCKE